MKVVPVLLSTLKADRETAGIQQRQVIERLPFPVTVGELARWEEGDSQPPAGRLDQLVKTYAVLCETNPADVWSTAVLRAARHPDVAGPPEGGLAIVARPDGRVDFI